MWYEQIYFAGPSQNKAVLIISKNSVIQYFSLHFYDRETLHYVQGWYLYFSSSLYTSLHVD